jgi:hypothetical protein
LARAGIRVIVSNVFATRCGMTRSSLPVPDRSANDLCDALAITEGVDLTDDAAS